MADKVVKVIPAKPKDFITSLPGAIKKKRVCAYARVSTEKDEQTNSYEAQIDYYTKYIKSNPEWEFVGIYSDEGITGTSIKKREGFKRMINDALEGKIDLILTKSVSRFARNTVDALTSVRKLRERNVEVFFEKENIYTLDSKGELLLTILSSLAQTESINISSNSAWGIRKTYADGKVTFAYSSFLGYEMGVDGKLYVVPEQAKLVRRIYKMYLSGCTYDYIARIFTKEGIPTPMKKTKWTSGVIQSILANEKYIGDSILQKTFCIDVLTKKRKKNEGELPQYYIENNHPAIISKEVFEMVKEERERREKCGPMVYLSHFSGRIQCGHCGNYYGRKVWHSNSPYKSYVWHCNAKYKNKNYCDTPTIKEKAIEECFLKAFNEIVLNKEEIIENYNQCIGIITDDEEYIKRRDELDLECEELQNTIKDFLNKCSKTNDDIGSVNKQYDEYIKQLEELQQKRHEASTQIVNCSAKKIKIRAFLKLFEEQNSSLIEFDPQVWQVAVDRMIIYHDMSVKIIWRDESETMTTIERGVREYPNTY